MKHGNSLNCLQSNIFDSGAILDTAISRCLLSQHLAVDSCGMHAHVIGESGDSEVPVWCLGNLAGIRLHGFKAQDIARDRLPWKSLFSKPATRPIASSNARNHLLWHCRWVRKHHQSHWLQSENRPLDFQPDPRPLRRGRCMFQSSNHSRWWWSRAGSAIVAR